MRRVMVGVGNKACAGNCEDRRARVIEIRRKVPALWWQPWKTD